MRSGRDRAAVATGRDALLDALPRDPALHVQRREERQRLEPSLTRLASHPAALPTLLYEPQTWCIRKEPQLRQRKSAFGEAARRSSRRAAPDARERIPTGASGALDPIIFY
jgi:hypothetical protein